MMLVVVVFKTKYLFEIMMLVVLVSYFWLDQLICIALFVRNNDVGGGCYLFEIMMLVVMVSYLRLDRLICMAYLFEIKMLVVIVSYFWLDQLICIAQTLGIAPGRQRAPSIKVIRLRGYDQGQSILLVSLQESSGYDQTLSIMLEGIGSHKASPWN
ncbi:hypothetical protein DPMN_036545 [Dreissena polymorpha]|uniref:Uncharacterized protein n=1 Tax=Dreissena polymorpha TaxID=45954 RepID=A0A9D4RN70_DREPO|nr:hypothetical protein DPMN_036545 [Dreissena polymorpha]